MSKSKLSRRRHILKALSWRAVGTIDTFLLAWFLTGEMAWGASIGGLELITKTILYYAHERAWYHIRFGREDKE